MNAKKCKIIRQELRKAGFDPLERAYVFTSRANRTVGLLVGCGRQMYRGVKGDMREGDMRAAS